MAKTWKPEKPKEISYALWALGAWAAWLFFFGVYQTWVGLPALQALINEPLQGVISVESRLMLEMAVATYGMVALSLVWVAYKVNQGKRWARTTLLVSFVLEVLWIIMPPYHGWADYLSDVPDLGLQLYALYLMLTWPGRTWFNREKWAQDAIDG